MTTITVLDSTGATQTVAKVANTGQTTGANSLPVVLASDQTLPLPALAATSTKQSDGSQITQLTGSAAQAAVGIIAKPNIFGSLQVSNGLTTLIADQFDTTLDPLKWVLTGTTPPVATSGSAVLSLTAANSVSSLMTSVASFTAQGQPFYLFGTMTVGAQQTNPNCIRFAGVGTASSFAAATPTTDGHQWEVDLTGALNACVYIAGVRYTVNSTNPALITAPGSWATGMTLSNYGSNLTWPASGSAIVGMAYYNGLVYFYMSSNSTGFDIPVGVASFASEVGTLPVRIGAITTPAVSTVLATTFTFSGFLMGAASGTNYTVSDPTYPWRQQSIDFYSRAYSVSPDIFVTGITAQTAASNNILLTAAGTTSVDTQAVGARSISIQIVPTGTVSSGVVSFEGSHDNITFVALPLYDTASLTANPVTTVSPLTGISRYFTGNTVYRYIRARISTVIGGGGSIQAFYTLSQYPYTPGLLTVTQASAGNLLTTATIGSGTVTTLSNGQTAHSAASTGSPLRIAGRVNTAVDTTLVAGDACDAFSTSGGALVMKLNSVPEVDWAFAGATGGIVNTTTAVTAKAAGAAGVRNYVTGVQIGSDTLGAATEFAIRDGASGTVLWRIKLGTTAMPATQFEFPTPLRGTAATLLEIVTLTATVTGGVYANLQGYQAP